MKSFGGFNFRLLKDRNVYENVAFAQRVVNRPTRVIRKRVPEVLQEVGLAGKVPGIGGIGRADAEGVLLFILNSN